MYSYGIIALLAMLGIGLLSLWNRRRVVSRRIQHKAKETLRDMDTFAEEVVAELAEGQNPLEEHTRHRGNALGPFWLEAVAACKVEFGTGCLPKDTPANRSCATIFITKYAKRHGRSGVRPSHILQNLPIALELVFVPTVHDLDAQEFARSRAVLARKKEWNREVVGTFWERLVAGCSPSA
jgi:hypothetical protein